MSYATFYTTGQKHHVCARSIKQLPEPHESYADLFREENGVWWLHCSNPSLDEVLIMSRALNLHELTTEDILSADVPDKFEQFDEYFFVVFSINDSGVLHIITTEFGVFSVYCGSREFDAEVLLRRLEVLSTNFERDILTPEWVTYAFVDTLTDLFETAIDEVKAEANVIERELFLYNGQTKVHPLLERMCAARDASVDLMRLFQGKPAVLQGLMKRNFNQDNYADMARHRLLTTVRGHLSAMRESTIALEDMLGRSFINYISIMRVKMVHSNSTMEQITGAAGLIGLALIPSHLVTSAWAMNCPVPGMNVHNEGWFWGVVSVMIVVVVGFATIAYFYFTRAVKSAKVTKMVGNADYK